MDPKSMILGWLIGKQIAGQRKPSNDSGTYYVGVTSTTVGDYTGATAIYSAGDTFPEVSDGDVYVYGDYEYRYNRRYRFLFGNGMWEAKVQDGWGVRVLDSSKDSYGKLLTCINGKNVVSLSHAFRICRSLVNAPAIPASVIDMEYAFDSCESMVEPPDMRNATAVIDLFAAFYRCPSLTTAPDTSNLRNVTNMGSMFAECIALTDISKLVLPDGVIHTYTMFKQCSSLKDASSLTIPPSVPNTSEMFRYCTALTNAPDMSQATGITKMAEMFNGCTNLTGTIHIATENITRVDSSKYDGSGYGCFGGTTQPITLTGTGTEANANVLSMLMSTATNNNVTIA